MVYACMTRIGSSMFSNGSLPLTPLVVFDDESNTEKQAQENMPTS